MGKVFASDGWLLFKLIYVLLCASFFIGIFYLCARQHRILMPFVFFVLLF